MPPPQQGPTPVAGSPPAAASPASSARRSYPVVNPEPQSEDSTRGPSRDGSGGRPSPAAAVGDDDQDGSGSSDISLIAAARRAIAAERRAAATAERIAARMTAERVTAHAGAAAAAATPTPSPKREARGSRRQEQRDRSLTPPPRGRHATRGAPQYRPSDDRLREWIYSRPNDWQPPVADYNIYTVPRLSELCRERGLPCTGLKDDIIRRLMKCDNRVMNRPTHVGPEISRTYRGARRRDARR